MRAETRMTVPFKDLLKLWKYLNSAGVGALNERPRAIDNRPYEFYRYSFEFCNMPQNTAFTEYPKSS